MASNSNWYLEDAQLLTELRSARQPAGAFGIRGYGDLREHRRGGQGIVFSGTQISTRRRVAIKVLLESARFRQETRRRFEREIDLIAGLSHPNIVRVFDSGTTDDGRLYFVMEFIDGASLDELMQIGAPLFPSIPATIGLFAKICDAVNCAHQRGVIHRDIKPSNVRVDRQGEPHVLDFGLAKVGGDSSAKLSVLSQTGQFMGSLPWASPEQTRGKPDAIDIRSDVYSLGVLLFQLLTGHFPYDVTGAIGDVLANIQSSDPATPRKLRAEVDGELATIVMKCLAKDPDRRYQSAGELARDVRHYLAGEPIEAKSDSAWYAVRKTLARYRTAARVSGAFLLLTIGATCWLAVLWQRAVAAEHLAADRLESVEAARVAEKAAHVEALAQADKARKITTFLDTTLRAVDHWKHPGRDLGPLRQMLDGATQRLAGAFPDQPDVEAALAGTLGYDYWTLGLYDAAEPLLRRAYELECVVNGDEHLSTMSALNNLASMLTERGRHEESMPLFAALLATQRRVLGSEHWLTLQTMNNYAYDLDWQGRAAEAEPIYREALNGALRVLGEQDLETLRTMNNLASVLPAIGKPEEALEMMQRVIDGRAALLGADHPETLQARMNYAYQVAQLGRVEQAEMLFRESLGAIESALGTGHPLTITAMGNLADSLGNRGEYAEALALERKALAAQIAFSGADSPAVLHRKNQLATLLIQMHDHAQALPAVREVVDGYARAVGADDVRTLTALGNLAYLLSETGAIEEAVAAWKRIIETGEPTIGGSAQPVISAKANLGGVYADGQRWADAEAMYRSALAGVLELKQDRHWRCAVIRGGLGRVLSESGKLDEAEANLLESHAVLVESLGATHERTRRCAEYLARLYEKRDDAPRAERFRTLAAAPAPASAPSSE